MEISFFFWGKKKSTLYAFLYHNLPFQQCLLSLSTHNVSSYQYNLSGIILISVPIEKHIFTALPSLNCTPLLQNHVGLPSIWHGFELYLCAFLDITYFVCLYVLFFHCLCSSCLLSGSEFSAKSVNCVYSNSVVQYTVFC